MTDTAQPPPHRPPGLTYLSFDMTVIQVGYVDGQNLVTACNSFGDRVVFAAPCGAFRLGDKIETAVRPRVAP